MSNNKIDYLDVYNKIADEIMWRYLKPRPAWIKDYLKSKDAMDKDLVVSLFPCPILSSFDIEAIYNDILIRYQIKEEQAFLQKPFKTFPEKIPEDIKNLGNAWVFLYGLRKVVYNNVKTQLSQNQNTSSFDDINLDDRLLSQEEIVRAEALRKSYLRFLEKGSSQFYTALIEDLLSYKIIDDGLKEYSPKEVLEFANQLEAYRQRCLELFKDKPDIFNFYSKSKIDCLGPYIFGLFPNLPGRPRLKGQTSQHSRFDIPNNFLAEHVYKNIKIEDYFEQIDLLQYINNTLESKLLGFFDDGENCREVLKCGVPYSVLKGYTKEQWAREKNKFITQLESFDGEEQQTAFTLRNGLVEGMVTSRKKEIASVKHEGKDNKTGKSFLIEYNLLTDDVIYFDRFFVKEKTTWQDGSLTLVLYVFPFDCIESATQVYRLDKVPKFFKGKEDMGKSRHKQVDGKVVDSYLHIHTYNQFDKALNFSKNKNAKNRLGHFDVDVNFIKLPSTITNEDLEEIFDAQCNIETKDVRPFIQKLKNMEEKANEQKNENLLSNINKYKKHN